MNRREAIFGMLATALPGASGLASAADTQPKRLSRAESFLGIHFDFHAGPDCTEVGKNTTAEMVNRIVDLVQPDYLQCDCKGHPGYTSYPTKVGNPAPGFVGDPLRVWRDATAKRGVALYVHYSGVIDQHAVTANPSWAALNADGTPNKQATSLYGPYCDSLMIPQLREIAGYGIDGIWVDGDCWGAVPDYSEPALAAWRAATGSNDAPRKAGEPQWREFLEFQRGAYRRYLNHFVTEVRRTNPGFQLCSNWAFTDHMPEPVSVPVDFLSGDFSPENSVNSARIAGRYLVRQGKPWDLMAWSFSNKEHKQKSAVQLQREAAVVLSLGGGFQAYFTQNRDGSVRLNEIPVMAEVAKFCRARQQLCHHAMPVPQIGLLFSTAAHYRRLNSLFQRSHPQLDGILLAMLESQHSVEVVSESQLAGRLAEYPMIVVPEWEYLEPAFRDSLAIYAKAGGNLLLIGPESSALFAAEFNDASNERAADPKIYRQLLPNDVDGQRGGSYRKVGKGRIGTTTFNMGADYLKTGDASLRLFLNGIVRQMFTEPLVEVAGSNDVDVTVARNQGKLLVHLVNTGGPHRTQAIIEAITPVAQLAVTIRLAARPANVRLEPSGKTPPFDYHDGKLTLSVSGLAIHETVVVTA